MIDFQFLVITLGILLGIVALTTIAAIGNKVYSTREESTKKAFLNRVRQSFLLLRTGIPDDHHEGMRRIVHSFSGRWSELAQVYKARLKDGRQVAVKVVYPNIERLVDTDLKLLRAVIWLESRLRRLPA